MGQIFWNTNRPLTDNCSLSYILFLARNTISVNEKFVYVGNQKITFIVELDLALILTATSESESTSSTQQSAGRPQIRIAEYLHLM